jgi:hypothetical protein
MMLKTRTAATLVYERRERSEARGASPMVALGAAVLVATVFFAVGYRVLDTGHPDEDAYILLPTGPRISCGSWLSPAWRDRASTSRWPLCS